MKTVPLPARNVALDDSWDVIVVGGGPSGCAAAASAARQGARTLLIEQTSSLGGMGTSALVPAWTPFWDKQQVIYGGIAEKVFRTCSAGIPHVKPTDYDWVPIDAERLKRIYDDLVTQAGAKVLFNTFLSLAHKENRDEIACIFVTNKSGVSALKAKVYIDCTGDADLCAWAGAQFHKGDDSGDPSNLMPATHCFILSNVDDYAARTGPNLYGGSDGSPTQQILKSGKYPVIPDLHCCQNFVGPGTMGFNASHVYSVDSTDPWSVSSAVMEGRKIAAAYRDALAEFHPRAFANSFLVATGSLLGVRESRRVVGDYVLSFEDYMKRQSFDDEICRNCYFIDVHAKVKEAYDKLSAVDDWEKRTFRYGPGESHGIPYRCLTPAGLKNVLVAGRSISVEQIVQGSVRIMACCLTMGEAAGAAAAMAIGAEAVDVHAVDVAELRRILRSRGAFLPTLPSENRAPAPVGAGT